ncbi:MAG TPA: hypothetical protein EYG85_03275 [Crocinitomix sp.]|nr:hypothetical protein [Crocinitomix sp.]
MRTLYHFLRLVRLLNLLVIILVMIVIQLFLKQDVLQNINFILLIVSTVLIASAGNIINDYFDVKADRINKPKRLIIGKYIKRRWAMVWHWFFNVLGLCIALFIGYKLQNVWMPIIAFLSINLLWFYSVYYKRKSFIGNLIVAFLIGILPLYVLIFNLPIENFILPDNSNIIYARYFIDIVALVSALAFLINLIREIVKDIQDVRGDMRLGAQTLPIKYGIKKTKLLVVFIFFLTSFVMIIYLYKYQTWKEVFYNTLMRFNNENPTDSDLLFYGVLALSFIFLLLAVISILIGNQIKNYKIASILLKISMILGVLTPLLTAL